MCLENKIVVAVAFLTFSSGVCGAMYDIANVCVGDDTSCVMLVPDGASLAIAPLDETGWTVRNFRNKLATRFGRDDKGRFFSLECAESRCDTAWQIRSSRVPVTATGAECILSFRLESNRRMRLQGCAPAKTEWRSGIFWYDGEGRQCAVTPVDFVALGGTEAFLRFPLPQDAVACEVQIGTDTPNVEPGHVISFRDVRLRVCTRPQFVQAGHFVSEVRHGGKVSWRAEIPRNTSVRFQYAAANDPVAALHAPFRGPDGTDGSFYTEPFLTAGRWIRYKVFLCSADGALSPTLYSVTVGKVMDGTWKPYADTLPPCVMIANTAAPFSRETPLELRISDGSAVMFEKFRAFVDEADATDRFVRQGCTYHMQSPDGGWADGLHTVDISIADCHGNAVTARRFFYVGARPRMPKVALRDDGMTLVEGKPFFPIGLYAVCKREFNGNDFDRAFADMKTGGFNFAHTYGPVSDEFLDAANRHGMKLWCAARPSDAGSVVERLRHKPAVLAWYLGDDTSDNTTPDELLSRESFIKAVDPTRISCQADPVGSRKFSRIASRYADYVIGTDVFMPELYPVRGAVGDETDATCVAKIVHDMASICADARENGDGRPRGIWAIIQYFKGWGNWGHFPSKEQLAAMTWAAVVHGAHGVTWYTYGGFYDKTNKMDNQGVTSTPDRWRNICELATHLQELSPILVERTPQDQPKVHVLAGAAKDPFGRPAVSCMAKSHGDATTLIAVNAAPEFTRVRFGVKGCSEADVRWEGRRIAFRPDGLEDDFAPFAVHIYQWRGASSAPMGLLAGE